MGTPGLRLDKQARKMSRTAKHHASKKKFSILDAATDTKAMSEVIKAALIFANVLAPLISFISR